MKVLFVSESVNCNSSGGQVVSRMAQVLSDAGIQVTILSLSKTEFISPKIKDNVDIIFSPILSSFKNQIKHLIPQEDTAFFKKILDKIKPDVVHFASYMTDKPYFFLEEALNHNCKLVLQPWIYNFFCAQGFAFHKNAPCSKCESGGFSYLKSIGNGCLNIARPYKILNRAKLQRFASKAHFLSTNPFMDKVLVNYGADESKITRIILPFDPDRVKDKEISDDGHYTFYGQSKKFKGIQVLNEVSKQLSSLKFEFYPIGTPDSEFVPRNHNTIVRSDLEWHNGLSDRIARSSGILIPSIWPTTTEYTLLESMGLRKPIVAFNIGAHQELLKHRENALLAPNLNIENYIECVNELSQNKKLRKQIGENAYDSFLQFVSPEKLLNTLLTVYNN